MKTIIYFAILVIIMPVFFGWVMYLGDAEFPTFQAGAVISHVKSQEAVHLVIDKGQDSVLVFKRRFKEGMTAFDLLKEKTEKEGLALEVKTYDFGVMIEAIGDVENGKEGKYWLYYVNSDLAPVSVDQKVLQDGDKVEFKFESSPF